MDSDRKSPVREWKEVTIPLMHGNIAAKWWAPYNVQPIVALHGWQDNAGSFDALIPLLPDHVGYLAIDLPGHGLSDRYPDGTMYGYFQYLYLLHQLVVKYKWSKVTIIGHSMGAIIAFLYAASFPDRCMAIVAIDAVKIMSNTPMRHMYSMRHIDKVLIADQRNQLVEATKPPTLTYDEMVAKMHSPLPILQVSPEFAPYLLERGIRPVPTADGEMERFYFVRDSRLKYFNMAVCSHEMCLEMASNITCAHLYIRPNNGLNMDNALVVNETLQIFAQNPLFESISLPGGHHVHLENARLVSEKISQFIRKYHIDCNADLLMAVHKL